MIVNTFCGTEVLIDVCDVQIWNAHASWTWPKSSRTPYVRARWYDGGSRKAVFLHRLIMNAGRGDVVDHINRDPLDNRRGNLRLATIQQNTWNRRQKNNTTGFIGVRDVGRGFFQASIGGGSGVRRHLLSSKCPIECAKAYDAACKEERGEFAVLNFP